MSDLQRMVYASRATFAPSLQGSGIELDVARILMQSRRNNPRRGTASAQPDMAYSVIRGRDAI